MMEESTEESVGLVERVCAIDIGKAGLVVCVRVPHESKPGRRVQQVVREYATTTPALLGLADWLASMSARISGVLCARNDAGSAASATTDIARPAAATISQTGRATRVRRIVIVHLTHGAGRAYPATAGPSS
jgi:hypothetical protein